MYLLITVHTMLLVSMCRAMPFSARALKKPTFLHWCCDKKWIEMWFIMVCNLIDKHPKHFLHVELVCKSFWKEVWHIQVSHLHNAAHAISSPSLCFQLSTNLDKDYFHYLWYCGKTTNRMWFSVVCTLIDNDTGHHSSQKVVVELWVCIILTTVMTRIIVDKSTDHTKQHLIC